MLLKVVIFLILYCGYCDGFATSRNNFLISSKLKSSLSMSNSNTKMFIKKSIAITLTILLTFQLPTYAFMPTAEDYDVGSGTYIGKRTMIDESQIKPEIKIVDTLYIKSALQVVDSMESLIKTESWDEILAQSKSWKLLEKPNFGFSDKNEVVKALGINLDNADRIESLREDLTFSLKQLIDLTREQRVIVFNGADRRNILKMKEASGVTFTEAMNDATDYLNNAKGSLETIISLL